MQKDTLGSNLGVTSNKLPDAGLVLKSLSLGFPAAAAAAKLC